MTDKITFSLDNEDHWVELDLGPDRERFAVNIIRTDEGVVLDLYGIDAKGDITDDTVATTYAFDSDVTDATSV